jgi:glycosyltransferase involved in cell wall biosynthesis
VAYLVNQYPKVSHTFIRREILALERQGVDVLRYALRGWDAEVVDPADRLERERTQYVLRRGVLPLAGALLGNFLRRPAASFRALRAACAMSRRSTRPLPYHLIWLAHAAMLRNWLAGTSVTHLHAHFGTNSADVAYLLRLLGGPAYSFTVHGADETDNAAHINLARKVGEADFVCAVSAYTRSQILRHIDIGDWPKVHVVRCGLGDDFFTDMPAPLPAHPVFLCIARLSDEKGHLILLEAFARVVEAHPDCRLILAGDGERRALLEARIAALKLGDHVAITGWIDSAEVRRLITESTVLVQPSLMEGLPVVIMEAMAQYRPVISTYIAGIPELVEPGRTGWLVPAGDAAPLADAMEAALASPHATLERMGRVAAERVRARHSIDTEAAKLASLIAGEEWSRVA